MTMLPRCRLCPPLGQQQLLINTTLQAVNGTRMSFIDWDKCTYYTYTPKTIMK